MESVCASASFAAAENFEVGIDEIISAAFQYEFVLSARAFEYDGNIVVALIVTPFILKSERDAALQDVQASLDRATSDKAVIATFDTTVFRRISGDMSDEYKSELLKLAKQRR